MLKVLRIIYRHNGRRSGSLWVGPINAALKHLKLPMVILGVTLTLSASSASLFSSLPVFGRLFLFRHPHGHTSTAPFEYHVLYQTPESSAAMLQLPAMPDDTLPCSPSSVCSSRPADVFPRSLALPTQPSWISCDRLCGAALPTTTMSTCARLLSYSHIRFAGRLVHWRG